MATSANAYLSTAGSAAYVNPTIWADAIEQVARQANILEPLGVVDNRALGSPGVQINVAKNQAFTAAALTAGTATPVTTLAFDQVTVTFGEVGLAKQVSMEELEYGLSAVFNDITMNMGEALSTYKDIAISTALAAGAHTTKYADSVTSGSISAANVFNTNLFADGITALRLHNRPAKNLVIHPNCENALLKDSQFVDASQYGGNSVVQNGEIGRYLGVRVMSSNNIQSATENSVTVYKNLLLGDRSFVIAYKRKPRMQWKEDSILDRAITFAADEAYGVSVLNSEAIAVLKSV
jgi:N4-gp56 family major capsid protein